MKLARTWSVFHFSCMYIGIVLSPYLLDCAYKHHCCFYFHIVYVLPTAFSLRLRAMHTNAQDSVILSSRYELYLQSHMHAVLAVIFESKRYILITMVRMLRQRRAARSFNTPTPGQVLVGFLIISRVAFSKSRLPSPHLAQGYTPPDATPVCHLTHLFWIIAKFNNVLFRVICLSYAGRLQAK